MARLSNLTHEGFADNWSDKPFILTDYIQSWPVYKDWTISKIHKAYPNIEFRAEAVDWTFSDYHSYMRNNTDESPLYLFDRKFAESMNIKVGHGDGHAYWAPECFGEDLFTLLGSERPAHRWLSKCPAISPVVLVVVSRCVFLTGMQLLGRSAVGRPSTKTRTEPMLGMQSSRAQSIGSCSRRVCLNRRASMCRGTAARSLAP
jgi:hypothetical protein